MTLKGQAKPLLHMPFVPSHKLARKFPQSLSRVIHIKRYPLKPTFRCTMESLT